MGKIYYNGVDYSAPVVSGVSGIKGNAETIYRTGNVNLTPANLGAAPISHAVTTTTYGKGTGTIYGHVKLSDTYTSSVGDASSGVAASQKALFDAYSTLNSNIINLYTKDFEINNISVAANSLTRINFNPAIEGYKCINCMINMTPNADWIMANIVYGGRIQLYNGFSSTLSGSLHVTCLYIKDGLTNLIQ